MTDDDAHELTTLGRTVTVTHTASLEGAARAAHDSVYWHTSRAAGLPAPLAVLLVLARAFADHVTTD